MLSKFQFFNYTLKDTNLHKYPRSTRSKSFGRKTDRKTRKRRHKVPFMKLIARINNLNRHYIQYLFNFNWRKCQLLKAKFTRNHRIRTWSISQVVLSIAVSRSQLIQTGPNEILFPRVTSLSLSYGGDPFKRWFHFCPLPPPP